MGYELMNSTWGGAEVKAMLVRFNNNLTAAVFKWAVLYKWALCSWGFLFTKPSSPGELGQWCLNSYNARRVWQFCSPAEQTGERSAAFYGVLLRFGLFFLRKVRRILIDGRWPWFHDGPPVGGVEGTPRLWGVEYWSQRPVSVVSDLVFFLSKNYSSLAGYSACHSIHIHKAGKLGKKFMLYTRRLNVQTSWYTPWWGPNSHFSHGSAWETYQSAAQEARLC